MALVDCTANNAWFGLLRIADDAGFVDVLAGEAQVGCGGPHVLIWNMSTVLPLDRHLSPILRRVVFISEAPASRPVLVVIDMVTVCAVIFE
jgi:hypothetical protein